MVAEWNLSTCPEGYFKIGAGLDKKRAGKTIYFPSRNAVAPRTMRSIREERNGLLLPYMNGSPEVKVLPLKLEQKMIPRPRYKAGKHGTWMKPQVDILEVIPELNSSVIDRAAREPILVSMLNPTITEDINVVKKVFLDRGTSMDPAELSNIPESPESLVMQEKKVPVYSDVAVQASSPRCRSVRCQTQTVSRATAVVPEETEVLPPNLKIGQKEIALIDQLYKKNLEIDSVLKKEEVIPSQMSWLRRIFTFVIPLILIFIICVALGMKYKDYSAAETTSRIPINSSTQSVGALFKQSLSDWWKIFRNLTNNLLLRCNWIALAYMRRPK